MRDNPAVGGRANASWQWSAGTRIFTKFARARDHADRLSGLKRMIPAGSRIRLALLDQSSEDVVGRSGLAKQIAVVTVCR
jgi:hypothetical protein